VQALHFHACENLILRELTHINSPRNHISLNACHGSRISELHIIAPNESPNTDGIDIAESSNIIIENSKIETGNSHEVSLMEIEIKLLHSHLTGGQLFRYPLQSNIA